jgi:hypothetical protein
MSAEAPSPIATYFRVCDGVRVRRIWQQVASVGRVVAIDMPGSVSPTVVRN